MYERLVGLNVTDEKMYQNYRDAMLPILESYGGGFSYDFIVSKVLKSQTEKKINRVFVIYFSDKETSDKFFSDPEYVKVKKTFFEKAVESGLIIAEYQRL